MQKSKINILSVEDDIVDRRAIKRALVKTSLKVKLDEAKTASEALKLIQNKKYDCVLLDYGLPDQDGLKVLQKIVNGEVVTNTPFIVLTGHDSNKLALKTLRAGAQDFLTKKGLRPAQLARAIINAIERQELITQNQKIRQELKTKADFMSVIDDTMADGLLVTNEKGKILTVNKSSLKIFGYSKKQVIGQNLKMLMDEEGASKHEKGLKIFLKTGESNLVGKGPREVTGKRKNGETFALEIVVNQVLENDHIVFVGCVRDVSKRKIAEAAAMEAEAESLRLGRIVEESLNEIYIIDPKTLKFMQVNRGARQNLGYSMDEMKNMTPADIKPEYSKKAIMKLFKPLLTGEREKVYFETIHQRKDGSKYNVDVYVQLSQTGKKPVFVGMIEDITEKKKASDALRQAQKMEAIGNLTGGIAHDFNNLLTAIQGSLQLLKLVEADLGKEARECLEIALKSSNRGSELTHRLLAFSRKQNLKPSVVEVNQLVRELIPMFRRTIHESITIETHLMDRKAFVRVDTGEMENALLNLTVNARDAMPSGGLLTFEVEETEVKKVKAGEREIAPGTYIILSVTDNGSGMSPEVRDQVFEPFFTTKGVEKGTGLGLSMVYGFVKQSGGHVTVYSEPGQGTTFKLYLKSTEDRTTVKPRKKKSFDFKAKQSGTILLVEDDEGVREYVAQALAVIGYTVLDVGDGPSALKVMDKTSKIDLLLTDVVLPKGMTGPDIGEAFEKKFPGTGIIYSSGYTGKAIEINGWLQNSDELLSKPYDLEVLLELVYDKTVNYKPKKKK